MQAMMMQRSSFVAMLSVCAFQLSLFIATVSAVPCGWDIDTGTPGKAGIVIHGLGKGFDDTYLQDTSKWFWKKGVQPTPSIVLDRFDENTDLHDGGMGSRSEIGRDGEVGGKYFRKWIIRQQNSSCAAAGTCEVYAACTKGCPEIPDVQMGWGVDEKFNTAGFPDAGVVGTLWAGFGAFREVNMTCHSPPPFPKCTETCDAAKCASVPIETCEDQWVSPCCKAHAAAWMPPTCECRTTILEREQEHETTSKSTVAGWWPPHWWPKKVMKCLMCGHTYDAAKDGGGLAFADLPSTWKCPVCGVPKSDYKAQWQADGSVTYTHEHEQADDADSMIV